MESHREELNRPHPRGHFQFTDLYSIMLIFKFLRDKLGPINLARLLLNNLAPSVGINFVCFVKMVLRWDQLGVFFYKKFILLCLSSRLTQLLNEINAESIQKALVFIETKRKADELTTSMTEAG